jgi:hypothetical protein
MRGWVATLILISLFLAPPTFADIYYWIDDQGTQYYTTRLESIPEPYRSKAIPLSLPTSPPVPPEITPRPLQKGPTRIPFTLGSPVLVSAKINGGGPITLILDTGADRTMVAPSALSRLGISFENALRGVVRGVNGSELCGGSMGQFSGGRGSKGWAAPYHCPRGRPTRGRWPAWPGFLSQF